MKTNNFICILTAVFTLCFSAVCYAQVDVEAVAQFYFEVSKEAPLYVDGFATIVDGKISPYVSHRSAGARDTAIVARTTDGTSAMTWRTAPIPSEFSADSVKLIWIAGFGNNQGDEKFRLDIDDQFHFEFRTSMEPCWRIEAGRLSFTAIATSRWGAYLGYMVATLPVSALGKNRAVMMRVTGIASDNEVWYRTYAYRDVLHFIRTQESKQVYDEVRFHNLGDAFIRLVADATRTGEKIFAFSDHRLINESRLVQKGAIAVAEICIPRAEQEKSGPSFRMNLAGQQVAELNIEYITEKRVKAFLEEELVFDQYVFTPGKFPGVTWRRPAMVDNELGTFELTTRYYDRTMTPVNTASTPGRYGAVVEGTTPGGFVLRRYVTLYCTPVEPDQLYDVELHELNFPGIQEKVWRSQRSEIMKKFSGYLRDHMLQHPEAAVLLAGLQEMEATSGGIDGPEIRDRQWWIEFKNKNQPMRKEYPALKKPYHVNSPGKTLAENRTEESIFRKTDIQKIRDICVAWSEDAGEPMATLVACNGRIIFHEAFGTTAKGGRMSTDTPTWMASITKLLTGVLMMQFVDQGLVQLDDPIGKYLPELGNAEPDVTIRHLFTHTAGLGWHGEWASDWNPALENYLAQCMPYLKVGSVFEYNRAGYAIAGKIMERITGRAVPYLFDEYLLKPLTMNATHVDNTYGSMYSTCLDLAHLGQMLLNRGVYGEYRFFSEESYGQMLPRQLPDLNQSWGIGTAPLGGDGLSDQAFGHEAASGAIFRMDPVHDLIIVSARNRIGRNYERYLAQLLDACTAPLKAKSPDNMQ